jgi:hypothetical protein
VTFAHRISVSSFSLALVLAFAGCVGGSTGSAQPPETTTAPPSSKTLNFATVQSVTAPIFQKDPNCAYGQWSENSTGIKEEFRKSAKTIQQFDCYLSKDDAGTIPKRVQQSIFVEFSDVATAKSFAEGESSLYPSLVAGPKVVVAGSGLETVDMPAYLDQLKSACGCGEIVSSGR